MKPNLSHCGIARKQMVIWASFLNLASSPQPLALCTSRLSLNISAVLSFSKTHVYQAAHALDARTELPSPGHPVWIYNLESGATHIICLVLVHFSLLDPMCLGSSYLSAWLLSSLTLNICQAKFY